MGLFFRLHITGLVLGIILDQIIGDPHRLSHPIRAIGNLISFFEKVLLGGDLKDKKRDYQREKRNGILLWFSVELIVIAVMAVIVGTAYFLNMYFGVVIEAIFTCYILAARSLCRESMAVASELEKSGIVKARYALSMIVGRDTKELTEEEVIKAAVETVAENTSDGVIAPLLYTALFGPVIGMAYKAVNTMDSMLGYHNDRYEYFGSFAARADDFFNFLPARISAVFMIAASFILGLFSKNIDGKRASKIWKRDRLNHKSPNSAQTESVCAGALGLKLGGTHTYKGVVVEKPTIGDEVRKPEKKDIKRANDLMFMTEAITAVVLLVIMCLVGFFAGI